MKLAHDNSQITKLTLRKTERHSNDRLLFGRPCASSSDQIEDDELSFKPLQLFSFVRWRADQYGSQTWRVVVAQAGHPGEQLTRIPGVKPGVSLLLHAFGKTKAKRALRVIDSLSEAHVLHEIDPAYWRHVHISISKNKEPELYDSKMFEALSRARSES